MLLDQYKEIIADKVQKQIIDDFTKIISDKVSMKKMVVKGFFWRVIREWQKNP